MQFSPSINYVLLAVSKYYYCDQITEGCIARACSKSGRLVNAYKIVVGKPEENRSPGEIRSRWEGNIGSYKQDVSVRTGFSRFKTTPDDGLL
jgi:hypothetical protein